MKMNKNIAPWINNDSGDFELAMTGQTFQLLVNQHKEGLIDTSVFMKIIKHTTIYSRMSPDDKALLIKTLQNDTDDIIAMCGDGANDCKALKAADVGLSLSEVEASIAASFTSKIANISPMIKLLREGRASLVT